MNSRTGMLLAIVLFALVLLSGCATIPDTCKQTPLGGFAGYSGSFTMDGRPATEQEIAARVVDGGDYPDALSYIHVKSFTDGIHYTAELDPDCPFAGTFPKQSFSINP